MHVKGRGCDAKIWLEPEISIADSYGFNAKELSDILRVAAHHRSRILRAWDEHLATAVRFDEHTIWVALSDGRTLGVPLAWFPRLLNATPAQRDGFEISRVGLHWEELDEDISIAGLLAGRGDMSRQPEHAA